jgi:GTP cyclohydrolase I
MSEKIDIQEQGDDHVGSSLETPIREGAFELSDDEKIVKISGHFKEIMDVLGLDLTDDSLAGTPDRVAKMFIEEIFSGLNPANEPSTSLFENNYQYNEMLIEKDIELYSYCEHHFVPIIGKVHVAYIPEENVVGLSKINRYVQYFAKRPQVQERLTRQIVAKMQAVLGTDNVCCVIEAKHLCVNMRGVKDSKCSTVTAEYGGKFKDPQVKQEFLNHINGSSNLTDNE